MMEDTTFPPSVDIGGIGVDSGKLANLVRVKKDHESKFEILTYVFLDFSWIILAVTRFSRGGGVRFDKL